MRTFAPLVNDAPMLSVGSGRKRTPRFQSHVQPSPESRTLMSYARTAAEESNRLSGLASTPGFTYCEPDWRR